ncbi:FxsA family protein [Salsuginibacillus kocurii]|uniref:FxsA family protein n=1 Tax=Salsuginibacillus kocurii TaxID=427078 RepID=UPI0003616DF0|nr:FxsA family protein [Salsuginibacillus kocurii]
MGRILLLLLLVVPTVEMIILISFGQWIGVWPTIFLVVLTGVVGAWLAKREGLNALRTSQLKMQNNEVPGDLLIDGICILIGGVVLLTPGFVTDLIGFFLLIPFTRSFVKGMLKQAFERMAKNGSYIVVRRK